VPADHLIGEENKGWTYAKHLLSHERTNIADVNRAKRELERLKRIAKAEGVWEDQRFRDQIALLEIDVIALEMLVLRVLSAMKSGKNPLDIAGLLKIKGSEIQQRYSELMMLAAGPYALPYIQEAMEAGYQGDFPATCWAMRRWPRPTSICARPPSTAAPTRCSETSSRRRCWADSEPAAEISLATHCSVPPPGGVLASFAEWMVRKAHSQQQETNMDFDFSDDQQQLRDAVARWVDKGYTFERRQSIAKQGGFSREVWNELAELGLTALTVPEQYGGLGQGAVDVMVVMEELGRGLVMEPLAQAFVASALLGQFGDEAVKQAWLPRIASGEKLVVLASQERKARYQIDVCAAKPLNPAMAIR
jgi:alkylation response protein AidB-like acyl-CoA dehydrogenase